MTSGIAKTALAAALLLLAACGEKKVETPAAPEGAGPAMWRVTDEDSTIYLFGTFARSDPGWRVENGSNTKEPPVRHEWR